VKNKILKVVKDLIYWKKYYAIETNADEIERSINLTNFTSAGKSFDFVVFEKNTAAPNILISPGFGGHSYVFAELAYLMHLNGFNVFIMPKHGGVMVNELISRHRDALEYIVDNYNAQIGVFGEGLGAYATFYLSLECNLIKSAAYMNGPVIMNEKKFRDAWSEGNGAAKRRKKIFRVAKFLNKIFPWIKFPIRSYLDFKEMIETKKENRIIETRLIQEGFFKDPDFDTWNPLSAIMSLVYTPPPKSLSELKVPTMFLVPLRGFFPSYEKDLFNWLPAVRKKIIEVDGGVFWMLSHPKEAAKIISEWFDETLIVKAVESNLNKINLYENVIKSRKISCITGGSIQDD